MSVLPSAKGILPKLIGVVEWCYRVPRCPALVGGCQVHGRFLDTCGPKAALAWSTLASRTSACSSRFSTIPDIYNHLKVWMWWWYSGSGLAMLHSSWKSFSLLTPLLLDLSPRSELVKMIPPASSFIIGPISALSEALCMTLCHFLESRANLVSGKYCPMS